MNKLKIKKRFMASYSVLNIIIIAMCAGLGIAIKPILVPLVHIITGPLFIPGGAVAGGFYMLFIIVARGLTQKNGAATIACTAQALLVLVTGVVGSHGIFSLITYVLPGVMVDLCFVVIRGKRSGVIRCFFAGMLANLIGTFLANAVFFRLPLIPLLLMLFAAALSGGLGGLISFGIINRLKNLNPILKKGKRFDENEE